MIQKDRTTMFRQILGLLQANMTNEFNQQGPDYNWKIELFRRLNLPSFAGVEPKKKKGAGLHKNNEGKKEAVTKNK